MREKRGVSSVRVVCARARSNVQRNIRERFDFRDAVPDPAPARRSPQPTPTAAPAGAAALGDGRGHFISFIRENVRVFRLRLPGSSVIHTSGSVAVQ